MYLLCGHHPGRIEDISRCSQFQQLSYYYLLVFFFFSQISGIFLMNHITWVGCQGSQPELRGYTCSLWKLFHTLTVQAGTHPEALDGTGKLSPPSPRQVHHTGAKCRQTHRQRLALLCIRQHVIRKGCGPGIPLQGTHLFFAIKNTRISWT